MWQEQVSEDIILSNFPIHCFVSIAVWKPENEPQKLGQGTGLMWLDQTSVNTEFIWRRLRRPTHIKLRLGSSRFILHHVTPCKKILLNYLLHNYF